MLGTPQHPLEGSRISSPNAEQRRQNWLQQRERKFLTEINNQHGSIIRKTKDNLVSLFGAKELKLTEENGKLKWEAVQAEAAMSAE